MELRVMDTPTRVPNDYDDVWYPVFLSFLAGSATCIGGILTACLPSLPTPATIALTCAFAAGVMTTVSIFDLWLPAALESWWSCCTSTVGVAAGYLLMMSLHSIHIPEAAELFQQILKYSSKAVVTNSSSKDDLFAPGASIKIGEPTMHTGSAIVRPETGSAAVKRVLTPPQPTMPAMGSPLREVDEEGRPSPRAAISSGGSKPSSSALRLGIMLSFILTAHNLPEGLAVGLGTVKSAEAGLLLCAAIFIHNVAEGVVVAVPILAGTGDRTTAIVITALSGLSEPVGALLGVWCMKTWFSSWMEAAIGFILCVVGGIMIAVSLMELLPQAKQYHSDSTQILQAFLAGCCVIGVTLLFL